MNVLFYKFLTLEGLEYNVVKLRNGFLLVRIASVQHQSMHATGDETGHNGRILLFGEVAVEVNRRVVRRADHGGTVLESGDVVELVTLVGGG